MDVSIFEVIFTIVLLESYPMIGMLMIPKTIAYIFMAYYIKKHYERNIL